MQKPQLDSNLGSRLDRFVASLNSRTLSVVAWSIWVVTTIAICVSVANKPAARTVTTNYREAADAFWNELPMYSPGQHGWLYPPQGAVLYSAFSSIPSLALGEVLWRITITALFVSGLFRLAHVAMASEARRFGGAAFLILTLSSIALAAGCMQNGQMNLPIAAIFIHACCDLTKKRWWWATFWLCLGLAAKPIALPIIMLAGAIFPALWWRLPIGLIAVLLLPFINPNWSYVIDQYQASFIKIRSAGQPGAGIFSDFAGMCQVFPFVGPGKSTPLDVDVRILTGIRAAAALVTLALVYLAHKRFGIVQGTLYLLLLGTGYLMVFNPRTEGNSYPIFVPMVGVLLAWALLIDKKISVTVALIVAVILFAAAHEFYKDKLDSIWIRPLCTLTICSAAAFQILRSRPPASKLFQSEQRG